jgi:hypothetical protein
MVKRSVYKEIDSSSKLPALNLEVGTTVHRSGLTDGGVVDAEVEHALGTSVVFITAAVKMTEVVVRTGILRANPAEDNT